MIKLDDDDVDEIFVNLSYVLLDYYICEFRKKCPELDGYPDSIFHVRLNADDGQIDFSFNLNFDFSSGKIDEFTRNLVKNVVRDTGVTVNDLYILQHSVTYSLFMSGKRCTKSFCGYLRRILKSMDAIDDGAIISSSFNDSPLSYLPSSTKITPSPPPRIAAAELKNFFQSKQDLFGIFIERQLMRYKPQQNDVTVVTDEPITASPSINDNDLFVGTYV